MFKPNKKQRLRMIIRYILIVLGMIFIVLIGFISANPILNFFEMIINLF